MAASTDLSFSETPTPSTPSEVSFDEEDDYPGTTWGFTIFRTYTSLGGMAATNNEEDPTTGTGTGTKFAFLRSPKSLADNPKPSAATEEISKKRSHEQSSEQLHSRPVKSSTTEKDVQDDTVNDNAIVARQSKRARSRKDGNDEESLPEDEISEPDVVDRGSLELKTSTLVVVADEQWASIYNQIRHGILRSYEITGRNQRAYLDERLQMPVEYRPGATTLQLISSLQDGQREALEPYIIKRSADGRVIVHAPMCNLYHQNLGILVDAEVAKSVLSDGDDAFVKLVDSTYTPTPGPDGQDQGEEVVLANPPIIYSGWMKVILRSLREIWIEATVRGIGHLYRSEDQVYDGYGEWKAH